MEKQEAIKLWKELKIESGTMEFSCGGDSMNDYSFTFYGGGKEIESSELKDYFDDAVYKHVEFYVNSDGHYQGEAGTVEITLDNDDDDLNRDGCGGDDGGRSLFKCEVGYVWGEPYV